MRAALLVLFATSLAAAQPPVDLQVGDIGLLQTQETLVALCAGRDPERAPALNQHLSQWKTEQAKSLARLREKLQTIETRQRAWKTAGRPLPDEASAELLLAAREQGMRLVLGMIGTLPDAQVRAHCERQLPALLTPQLLDAALAAADRVLDRLPAQPPGPLTVILVRHAEKASEPGDDPALSEAGKQRAEQLAALLQGAGITHILTSDRRRTQQTATPLAQRLGLQPQAIATRGGDHIAALLAAVRARQGGTLLVVGHSNTVPALIAALGGPKLANFCENRYGQALVLRLGDASLLRLHYGDADPAVGPGCS